MENMMNFCKKLTKRIPNWVNSTRQSKTAMTRILRNLWDISKRLPNLENTSIDLKITILTTSMINYC